VETVDPVEDVESAVRSKHEEVVAGDGLRLAGLGHHEELGKDSARLKVDREGPQDLGEGELVVDDERKDDAGSEEELNAEGVVVAVVRWLELHEDQVAGTNTAGNVDDLHGGVIDGHETHHEIKIPGTEYHGKQRLGLAGNSSA